MTTRDHLTRKLHHRALHVVQTSKRNHNLKIVFFVAGLLVLDEELRDMEAGTRAVLQYLFLLNLAWPRS